MSLNSRVRITRRFQKSIRIDSDLGDLTALHGFICPQSSARVLVSMARHVSEAGQGAFTWTGPYGSGKSSLIVALSALLASGSQQQHEVTKIFGAELTRTIQAALPTGNKGWQILPVVARRDNPVLVLGDAMQNAGLVNSSPRSGWTESNLVAALTQVATSEPETHGGLVLFIDEMGKLLEAANEDNADIYLLQQLAEAANRSNGRLLVVGILHQAFGDYAQRFSTKTRDEWAKIQGRFIDLVVDTAREEQLNLIARAIESDHHRKVPGKAATVVANMLHGNNTQHAGNLAATLESCWPLHPVVACLLGAVARQRFGQNQRSIFGFLGSAEWYGFQHFLSQAKGNELYSPVWLWDYLRANLEPSILASPTGHCWALAAEVLARCELSDHTELHLKLLKTIAVIDFLKEKSGLVATTRLLHCCFPETPTHTLAQALKQLDDWSFTVFRKFTDSRVIFAGSDFDLEQSIRSALGEIGNVELGQLKTFAGLQPILAKRHYHTTGAMRWFDTSFVPVEHAEDYTATVKLARGEAGQFLLTIPTAGETTAIAKRVCRKAAQAGTPEQGDIVVGTARQTRGILPRVRELFALERISSTHPELAGDPVARQEVRARLAELQTPVEVELSTSFARAAWFHRDNQQAAYQPTGNAAQLNSMASSLADNRFKDSPLLNNELLNRQRPSVSAITAQNKLLNRMLTHEDEYRLGIKGFPAEGGLFISIFESARLHGKQGDKYCFLSPLDGDHDPCNLKPMWQAAANHIKANSNRAVAISELYDLWRKPPLGVKDGVMPVLVVAFILSQRNRLAIYRDGLFRVSFDDVDVSYLIKDPTFIQLRWLVLSELSCQLLLKLAHIAGELAPEHELEQMQPIDVGRSLVAIYDRLPKWATRTMRLSANALAIRAIFKKAHDPNRFLFDDIPELFGKNVATATAADLRHIASNVRTGLAELKQAYPGMLRNLQHLMLTELQVVNTSDQSLAELHDRAENVRQLAGDFRLDAFINRLAAFDGSAESFEGIASLVANKPPREWTDLDLDKTGTELALMAQKFLRVETVARVKGRKDKRHAMAIVVGMGAQPVPLMQEFELADTDQLAVNRLINRVTAALEEADTTNHSVVLAALAKLSCRYMTPANDAPGAIGANYNRHYPDRSEMVNSHQLIPLKHLEHAPQTGALPNPESQPPSRQPS